MATPSSHYINTDGNTAVANIAYGFSEVAAIYPITPSSDMGERADGWAAEGRQNMFGQVVDVVQMQSEGGAAGAIHGALTGGAMATTFTASQGLMLMVPNMFKIAGELLPTVFHVSARSLACQSLSIFGDHSDVMATRGTGFAMLCSANVQEAQDMAAIAHLATLESKIPFLHFFDGFRTSHSIQKIKPLSYTQLRTLLDMRFVEEFRQGALRPEAPVCKVGAQNPDVYFQGRETVNRFYLACPDIIKKYLALFARETGRAYKLFEYTGDPEAESVLISMGSSAETIEETIKFLRKGGRKVGALRVRLYRPFHLADFLQELPPSVKRIAVLDRTKEPGALGEPLYLDVVAALAAARPGIRIIGGRYGLSSKEFTPSMVKAVYDHLDANGWHGFTVGINDDVTQTSIPVREEIDTEQPGIVRCKFWGYGSDGTVSANKNAIKMIGDSTDLFVQGYFQYDSNKSGGWTISHLRFGKQPIQSEYLLNKVDFVALHRPQYIGLYDILEGITEGGTFLLNSSQKPENIFRLFTQSMQDTIRAKKIRVFVIDASKIARSVGLGGRISSVMQTAFFKVSGVLPEAEAIAMIKEHVREQFARKGQEIVEMNWRAIDASAEAVMEVPVPDVCDKFAEIAQVVPPGSGVFAETIMDPVLRLKGDGIPVSAMPVNGAIPTGTKRLEYKGVPGNPAIWIDKLPFVTEPYIAEPYIEYPPSCSGCGEVPYLHLVTQLYGDRMIIANATGCTSIFGGTFPLTPYTKDKNGKGPAWANSLFEDNAEYGLGMRLAVDANRRQLKENLHRLAAATSGALSEALNVSLRLFNETTQEAKAQADELKKLLANAAGQVSPEWVPVLQKVIELQDYLIEKSIWIVGGDGWAYDIGFGGVDHVMAGNRNVNLLVLDTEVYSNTGGQASKATPRGAVAKFASNGKQMSKKNLGVMMAGYSNAYVASVNMGVDREKTALAFVEAEKHNGPSLIIAYSPCIAHGYDMRLMKKQSEKATKSGYWPMYRFNPELRQQGQNPLIWDAPDTDTGFQNYIEEEVRYTMLNRARPEEAQRLQEQAERDNEQRTKDVKHLSESL